MLRFPQNTVYGPNRKKRPMTASSCAQVNGFSRYGFPVVLSQSSDCVYKGFHNSIRGIQQNNPFGDLVVSFKGCYYRKEIVLLCTRWYLAHPLSYRDIEEMMKERGVDVDHATLNRWVLKFTPFIEKEFRSRKRSVGGRWRMDETSVSVKGEWKFLYRAVDKEGLTFDFIRFCRKVQFMI